MLAYTGVETVSNLAEEARDPVRNVPSAYRLVAYAVFAIYFTLPLIALSALPVQLIDGELTTLLALPPEEGGYANDPILGVVENLGPRGRRAGRARDLRRRPRRDDPLHRHERRRDRRIADHLLDGDATARSPRSSGGCIHASRRRGSRIVIFAGIAADPGHPARRRQVRRHALLVRRDALVHRRARLDRPAANAAEARRSCATGRGRTSDSAASTGRSSRSSAGSPPGSRSQ